MKIRTWWTQERPKIKALRAELAATDDGSGEESAAYLVANRRLDEAVRSQPRWLQGSFLYL